MDGKDQGHVLDSMLPVFVVHEQFDFLVASQTI